MCRIIAAATAPGALQLLRFGTTLAAWPASSAGRIKNCTLLALSHQQLLQTQPSLLAQVPIVSHHVDVSTIEHFHQDKHVLAVCSSSGSGRLPANVACEVLAVLLD